ncbi:MAG: hypothetical protein V3T17_17170 [Pseudomonadales bacterium]
MGGNRINAIIGKYPATLTVEINNLTTEHALISAVNKGITGLSSQEIALVQRVIDRIVVAMQEEKEAVKRC